MNGRKARHARRMFSRIQQVAKFPDEILLIHIRQKTFMVPMGTTDPKTGLAEKLALSFTTSTQVIPARAFYRSIKRDLKAGRA